jgi:predicted 3-demethylubiquinone-9 3-methyltransferase (glyoxalase superfamily)
MFGGANNGRGQEAVDLYTGLFDAQLGNIVKYDQPVESIEAGSIMYGDFQLARQWFAVMDSGPDHVFTFNEAVSLAVKCDDQAEIDKYWSVLSTVPESEQCGWCKDQLGVSWQIVPAAMGELMSGPDAYGKMMQMKKIIIKDLEEAN